jgi:hypothetical protein
MFKKKSEKVETKVELLKKEPRKREFHSHATLLYCIQVLEDALKTGQLKDPKGMCSSENSKFYAFNPNGYYAMGGHGHLHPDSMIQSLDKFEFVPEEVIRENQRKEKCDRLEKLRKEQAEKVSEIEQLARELGQK